MNVVRAFSPAGISGFFAARVVEGDPLRTGAIGGGVAIEKGVYVEVRAEPSSNAEIVTLLEGRPCNMYVARRAAELVLSRAGKPFRVVIDQKIEVPIGGGLGTSGASAVATALAVAKASEARLSYLEAARAAHVAEVESKTGLGTVSGLVRGGAVLVTKPGAPGFDEADRILVDGRVWAVVGFFGPISKASVLEGKSIDAINDLGLETLKAVVENPTPENFMARCLEFARATGLAPRRVLECAEQAVRAGAIGASQTMIGDAVFALVDEDLVEEISSIFRGHGARVLVSRICWTPARLL